MDLSGQAADIHMRTDANNLVTTARTTHLPEQRETIHLIHMLRHEACSGSIHDLAHIRTAMCLSDALTKKSAKADELLSAVQTGLLKEVDVHPNFRDLMQHRAYASEWFANNIYLLEHMQENIGIGDYFLDDQEIAGLQIFQPHH